MSGYPGYGGMPVGAAPPAGGGSYGAGGGANLQLQQLLLQQLQGATAQAGSGNPNTASDPYAANRQAPYDPYAASGLILRIE